MGNDSGVVPVVSFRQVAGNEYATAPLDIPPAIRSYGYNDVNEEFQRPEHYIRYIEPIESELAKQVEYDMDEQDREWLDVLNVERQKEQVDKLSYEVFEIIMDRLEKEWFDLMKRVPTPASALPVEDSRCAICDDSEGENANAIVFCDGCNLAVHQDCYGVPYIPEGQWLCRKCTVSPENPVDCILCPGEAGAFKQTTFPSAQWAHLLCAIWIPEVGVGNTVYMEPIEGVESIPKSRWRLVCSICKLKTGACIQCDNRSCFTAFHVTCARSEGLLSSMKSLGSEGILRAYCHRHIPADHRSNNHTDQSDDEDVAPADSATAGSRSRKKPLRLRDSSDDESGRPLAVRPSRAAAAQSKSARAHAKVYTSGPPLVPHLIVKNLMEYIKRIVVRKKLPLVERICRYWSLKREARRGAPLLKRLHLEPWTASHESKEQSDADKAKKMEYLGLIRNDLERVRMLAELVRKREKEKLRQVQIFRDLLDDFVYLHDAKLRLALEKISALDRSEVFLNPVSKRDVLDYYDVIKNPMCWSQIDDKLEKHMYGDVQTFVADIHLVLDNAMIYNPKDHVIHKLASRISSSAKLILQELALSVDTTLGTELQGKSRSLEAPASRLEALLGSGELDGSSSLLDDLFSFRLEPPPIPEPVIVPKPKRPVLSAEEIKARKEARKARFSNPAPPPMRTTRTTERLREEVEPATPGQTAPAEDTDAFANSRRRTRSGAPSASAAAELSPSQIPLSKQKRPQKGIAGLAPYSPLTDGERRRREGQMEIVVDHVDERDHFKRFNVGWVLPQGLKRGGRAPPPPPAPPAARRSRGVSQASSAAALANESSTSRPAFTKSTSSSSLSEVPDGSSPLPDLVDAPMEEQPAESSREPAKRSQRNGKRKTSSHSGEVPATKKQRPIEDSKKADEVKAAAGPAVLAAITHAGADSTKRSRKAAASKTKGKGKDESGISADADATVTADQTVTDQPEQEEDVDPVRTERLTALGGWNNGNDREEEGDAYPHGTLVWAKTLGFCFFPGEIVDVAEDYYDLPGGVWNEKPEGEAVRLVRFFDATRSYAWCPESRLDLLGESDEIDQGYLAGKNKGSSGRFRTPQMGKLCRAAYREAMYQMDIGDGAE